MQIKGTIRNVVDFGAFVDIGVKVDGLLHSSKSSADNAHGW
jgi:protein Tex